MFIALDKLHNQGLKQTIVAVPEKSIGSSFNDELLSGTLWGLRQKTRPGFQLPGGGSELSQPVIYLLGRTSGPAKDCARNRPVGRRRGREHGPEGGQELGGRGGYKSVHGVFPIQWCGTDVPSPTKPD